MLFPGEGNDGDKYDNCDNDDVNGNYDNDVDDFNGVDHMDVDGLMMLMFLMIHDRAGS